MAHRFLSPAWIEAGRQLVAESDEFRRLLGDRSTRILTIVTDAPDEGTRYLYYLFDAGRLARVASGNDPSHRSEPAEFTITGSYATFADLQRGTLTLQAAYFQRRLRLQGDLEEALRFAPAFLKFQELVRRVETEY